MNEIKYLSVVTQSDLKFNRQIARKVNSAKNGLGCIKYALNDAPSLPKFWHTLVYVGQYLSMQMFYGIKQTQPQLRQSKIE